MEPHHERWKARSADGALNASQRAYARGRARKSALPYMERLNDCERAGVVVKCACPGKRDVRWFTCRAHLVCRACRKRRGKQLRSKIHAALAARLDEAPRGHQLVMMTITLEHTGDVGDDRRELMDSWRRFRKAYHRRWGRFSFVATHEVTPGTDGAGHPHAHVVCVWPWGAPGDGSAGDWELLRKMWIAACPTARRVSFEASRTPKNAARYISKYVSKGVQTDDFSPQLRAIVLAGTYNTRWIFTSRAAWVPFQPCCQDCGTRVIRANHSWHGTCAPTPDSTPEWADPGWQQDRLPLDNPNAPIV